MRRFAQFRRNVSGAVLIEHTLVFVLLMLLTFGLVEFGVVLYQYNAAETATSAGARFVATRGPVITEISDCGVTTSARAGTRCADVSGASGWTLTCDASAPTGNCQGAVLNQLVAEMQRYYPNVEAQNVQVVFRGAGLGFVGRGAPVPLVTVRLTGMAYEYIAVGALLGISDLDMPGFDATLVGEDLNGQGA